MQDTTKNIRLSAADPYGLGPKMMSAHSMSVMNQDIVYYPIFRDIDDLNIYKGIVK